MKSKISAAEQVAEIHGPEPRKQKRKERDKRLVSDWLGARGDEDHTTALRTRRKRMLGHPDMPNTVRKLMSVAHPEQGGEDVRAFLDHSFALPELWEYRKSRSKDFVSADTKDLETHAEAFRSALEKHFHLVCFYLSETRDGKHPSSFKARKRFKLLVMAATFIRDRAMTKKHWISNKDIPPAPALPGHENARVQFCMRALSLKAIELFGGRRSFRTEQFFRALGPLPPKIALKAREAVDKVDRERLAKGRALHSVIAVLVSSSLGLSEPLTSGFVKQYLRHQGVPPHLR